MYLLDKAEDLEKASDFLDYLSSNTGALIALLIGIVLFVIVVLVILMFTDDNKKRKTIVETKVVSKNTSVELPCGGDLFIAYFVLSKCNLTDYLSIKGNLISSFYLKWIKKGLLRIESIDPKDGQAIMSFDDNLKTVIDDNVEKELYVLTKQVLVYFTTPNFKPDDLIKYLISNNHSMAKFFKDAYDEGKKRIIKIGPKPDETKSYYQEYTILPFIQELKKEIMDFRNFIDKYTEVENKEFESVKVLDNYYIFANLLGLRENIEKGWFKDKVNKDMVRLTNSNMFSYINNYVHTNCLYSTEEYDAHKDAITKSEQGFNKRN